MWAGIAVLLPVRHSRLRLDMQKLLPGGPMIHRLLIALALVACGGKPAPSSAVRNTTAAEKSHANADGKEGAVCAFGDQHKGSGEPVACAPGLNCCYPCGIDGCDSVCMRGDCPTDIP
jgi:hypothetical protein